MPIADFSKLSSLIKNYERSFWNGDARLSLTLQELSQALSQNPDITVGQLQQQRTSPLLESGLSFESAQPVRLGELKGEGGGFSISITAEGGAAARMVLVLSPDGLARLQDSQLPRESGLREVAPDLGQVLHSLLTLKGQEALLVFVIEGRAGAGLAGTASFAPPLQAGFSFKAGTQLQWIESFPMQRSQPLLQALRDALTLARLPATPLKDVLSSGHSIVLRRNQMFLSRRAGFLTMGASLSFGYSFQGTRNFTLGRLDLASTLLVEVKAELKAGYQLAGGFQIAVLAGEKPGWTRVAVTKRKSSTFDFAFGVSVDLSLDTPGAQPGLPLVESVLGMRTGQVLERALALARLTPQQWVAKADGFVQGVVSTWVGKAISALPEDRLQEVLDKLNDVRTTIEGLDQKVLALYERLLGEIDFPQTISQVKAVLAKADLEARRRSLLDKVPNTAVRRLVEGLLDEHLPKIYTEFEQFQEELVRKVDELDTLVGSKAERFLADFIRAKEKALKLDRLAAQLAKVDSPEALSRQVEVQAQELAVRLVGKPIDEIVNDRQADEIIKEINKFAASVDQVVAKAGDLVSKGLNSRRRASLSYAYQRAGGNERLVDIEIRTGTDGDPDMEGIEIYRQAAQGDFREALAKAGGRRVKLRSATFSDLLKRTATLKVNVFGWDFQATSEMLSKLEAHVEITAGGSLTVYKYSVEGMRKKEDRQRTISLNYLLQVTGAAQGIFAASEDLRRQAVSAQEALSHLESRFDYSIADRLATLDELQDYFRLALNLRVITAAQLSNLVETVATMRGEGGLGDDSFGKVEVSYSFRFEGKALARALSSDFSKLDPSASNNREALERIYAERLVASYPVHRNSSGQGLGVAALYEAGFLERMRKVGNIAVLRPRLAGEYEMRRPGFTLSVPVHKTDIAWAHRHYLINRSFSRMLEGFRRSLTERRKMKLADLAQGLDKLGVELGRIARGPQRSLPLLIVDEMVRRSSPGDAEAPIGCVLLTLYDPSGQQPLTTIPIHG